MKHLTATKTQILKSFIENFLPENDRLIKVKETELIYITEVLNNILSRWFYFKIGVADVFEVFEKCSYSLSVIEPRDPSRIEAPYVKTNSGIIYINISPIIIKELEAAIEYLEEENAVVKSPKIEKLCAKLIAFETSKI